MDWLPLSLLVSFSKIARNFFWARNKTNKKHSKKTAKKNQKIVKRNFFKKTKWKIARTEQKIVKKILPQKTIFESFRNFEIFTFFSHFFHTFTILDASIPGSGNACKNEDHIVGWTTDTLICWEPRRSRTGDWNNEAELAVFVSKWMWLRERESGRERRGQERGREGDLLNGL